MDSVHWDWGTGFCRKHPGNGVPCPACIRLNDPDLVRTVEEAADLLDKPASWVKEFVGENPCVEVQDAYERDREEWAERVKSVIEQRQDLLPKPYRASGEYFDWKSVRPVGEPIKKSNPPAEQRSLETPDFRIDGDTKVKGIFVIEGYDGDGNLIETLRGENTVSNEGFERMLGIDFSKLPKLPMSYCDPTTGHWTHVAGDPDAVPNAEAITNQLLEDAGAIYLPPRRAELPNVADCDQPYISEVRFKEPLTLHSGDTLLVSYTVKADDPNIEMRTRPLPLAERLALVAEQHRQSFIDAGIEDPDDLLKMLGTEELIQPKIPGFELPTKLPRRVPIDMELIDTIIEAEGCSDELR
jgi:hypothetical protein